MNIDADISVECERWHELGDLEILAKRAIDATCTEVQPDLPEGAEVSLLFCDDQRIQELNRDWRGMDKPTNVLSFPSNAGPAHAGILGDIAVAYETVKRESDDEGKTLSDHLSHMIVHGFLHLLGFDHETDQEAEEMEDAERRSLAHLGVSDPYAATMPVNERLA